MRVIVEGRGWDFAEVGWLGLGSIFEDDGIRLRRVEIGGGGEDDNRVLIY